MAGDDDFWTRDRDYGGVMPQSLNRMREQAHRVLATPVITSATERGMARAILLLLDELRAARGE